MFTDCRYEVMLDNPATRVEIADVLTLTGRIRNLSHTAWEVGSGTGRWSVAGYLTRIGRRKPWLCEFRTRPPDSRVPPNGELEFVLPIDTRRLPAGVYEVWIDMLMEGGTWMAFHGAVPASKGERHVAVTVRSRGAPIAAARAVSRLEGRAARVGLSRYSPTSSLCGT